MFPLWVAVLSWPVLGERTRPDVWLAAGIGVVGVYFLQQQPAIPAAETDFGVLPVITAVTASLASAIAMLGLHKLKGVDTRAIVAHFSGVSMACSALALCFMATPMVTTSLTVPTLILLGVVGVSATAGQILLTKAFASGPPAQVSVIGLSQVAFSMTLETVFHGRTFSSTTLLGLALVVLPTAWVLTRKTTSPAAAHCESEASPESAEAMEAISDV
jgi:drug/metabolite transporter (DMT)-like permease